MPGAYPPWDPIISFSHTFSLKSTHVGGPRPPPPQRVHAPPTGNPGSATVTVLKTTDALSIGILGIERAVNWQIERESYLVWKRNVG